MIAMSYILQCYKQWMVKCMLRKKEESEKRKKQADELTFWPHDYFWKKKKEIKMTRLHQNCANHISNSNLKVWKRSLQPNKLCKIAYYELEWTKNKTGDIEIN